MTRDELISALEEILIDSKDWDMTKVFDWDAIRRSPEYREFIMHDPRTCPLCNQ